jgi:hypothetical protein
MSEITHLGQGAFPLASNPNPSPSNLDQDAIMVNDDGMDELAGCDEADISSGRLMGYMGIINNEGQVLQSHCDTVDARCTEARYAENFNAADVAHVLQKAPTPFQAFKEDQNRLDAHKSVNFSRSERGADFDI